MCVGRHRNISSMTSMNKIWKLEKKKKNVGKILNFFSFKKKIISVLRNSSFREYFFSSSLFPHRSWSFYGELIKEEKKKAR